MSFIKCIDRALADGDITPEQAAKTRTIFAEEHAQLREDLGDQGAMVEAEKRTVERLEAEALQKKRQVRLQQIAARRVQGQIMGAKNPGEAAADLIEHFGSRPWASVVTRFKVVRGRAHALMSDVILRFERDALSNTRNKADLRNVVREAFGKDTGDETAKNMAGAWAEAAEFLRRRYNAAGGAIAKRSDWGLPQKHDTMAIRGVPMKEWIEFVEARLDLNKMVDDVTGKPLTKEALRARMVDIYHAITTDGWSRKTPSMGGGGTKLANRRADRRFLVFRDADTWLQYQDKFGHADAFSAMMEHIDAMARDVASLEVLGPNPSAMVKFVRDLVERDATMRDANSKSSGRTHMDQARGKLKLMDDMWSMHTGASSAPVDGQLSRWVSTIANLKVSAQLGSAFISAMSDNGFTNIARGMVGMDGSAPLGKIISLMKPGENADKRAAIRLGLVAEGAANMGAAQARYAGEFVGHEWARRLADITLRWSLLSPWTQAGRWSFGMEFMGFAADNAQKSWGKLPKDFRETLSRHGFDTGTWDAIRAAKLYEPETGATFLRPEEISSRSEKVNKGMIDALADQYLGMILTETEYAVPSASLRGRSFLVSQNQPGTLVGTVLRSLSMYKSFPSTVMILYGGRGAKIAAEAGGVMAGRFAAKMVVTTTLLGALAIQLKEISKGKDPRPMTDANFWGASLLQGGGLGIFGDFLGSDVNRFGGGLAPTIAGPLGQLADDVRRLTIGNAMEFAAQEETNISAETMRFMRQNTPGGSIWYLRLAYERLLLDEVQGVVDEDASQRFRRTEQRAGRRGQGYWWAPGDRLPERAPDLSNVMEPAPQ